MTVGAKRWVLAGMAEGKVAYATWENRVVVFETMLQANSWIQPGWWAAEVDLTGIETASAEEFAAALLRARAPQYGDGRKPYAIIPDGAFQRCKDAKCGCGRAFRYLTSAHRTIVFPSWQHAEFIASRIRARGHGARVVDWDFEGPPIDSFEVFGLINPAAAEAVMDGRPMDLAAPDAPDPELWRPGWRRSL